MKLIRISMCTLLVANLAGFAFAQYGLYGSPDTLKMPQQQVQQQQQPANPYPAQNVGQPGNAPGAYSQQVGPYGAPNGYVAPQQQNYNPVPGGYTPQMQQAQPAGTYPPYNPPYRTASAPKQTYIAQQPAPQNPPTPAVPEPIPAWGEQIPQPNPSLTGPAVNEQSPTGSTGSDNYVPYGNTSSNSCSSGGSCSTPDAACDADLDCGYNACPWYASLTGLALTRNRPTNKLWTTYAMNDETAQLSKSQDVQSEWKFGGEIRFGRRFCSVGCDPCNNNAAGYWALEASYWTFDPFDGMLSRTNPNRTGSSTADPNNLVGTPLTVGNIYFTGVGDTGHDRFDNAQEHRLWRYNELHSAEINFVHGQWANVSGSNWDFAFSIGPRFVRFYEKLQFGATTGVSGSNPSWNDPSLNAYLTDKITNNFWGGQLGFDLGYNCIGGAMRFFAMPKVGVYNNYITNNFQAALGDGTVAHVATGFGPGTYPVDSTTNTLSVISQIDVGAEWFFARRWSAKVGYRLLAISGVGLADNQFPHYINAIPEITDINTNGELFLHGGFASLTFNF